MKFIEQLRTRLLTARQARNAVEAEILQVVIGDIQTEENKKGRKGQLSDEEAHVIVRKIVAANEETMRLSTVTARLEQENEVLNSLGVPKMWTAQDIENFINSNNLMEQVKSAPKEGIAVGLVIKELKKTDAVIDGNDVKTVITKIRS